MNRRSCIKRLALLGGSVAVPMGGATLVGRHRSAAEPGLASFSGRIMGTSYSVTLGSVSTSRIPTELSSLQTTASAAHQVLTEVDESMSTWLKDSELSLINRSADTDWIRVSPATFTVIESALATNKLSNGAFDATIGPMVDLWGFGASAHSTGSSVARVPSKQEIRAKQEQVGFQFIDIDTNASAIRKLNIAAQLDLSGIAKGYAVDQLASAIERAGYLNYLVEVGGELRSSGSKPNGQGWRVAIETPYLLASEAYRVFELNNMAVATSGDYRHFFTKGDKRYSHSIDPRTGYPTNHALASVTVVAQNAMQADGLSTALMIMGPDDAMEFCEANALAAQFIVRSRSGELAEKFSNKFLTSCV